MNIGIYTITNIINKKIYVGYSTNLKNRWSQHVSSLKLNNHINNCLQNAVNKYGIENFEFDILVECNSIFLTSEEHYWCNILKVHDRRYGYNLRPTHPEDKIGIRKEARKRRKVVQFTVEGVEINSFNSIIEAEKNTKIDSCHISSCCSKKKNKITAGGFIWRYEGDDLDLPRKVYKKFSKKDVEDIRKLRSKNVSFKDIAEKYQVDDSYIHLIIKNKRHKI